MGNCMKQWINSSLHKRYTVGIYGEQLYKPTSGRRGHNRMVVRFTATCAISAYHHSSCELKPRSWGGALNTTVCDKVCQFPLPIKLTATI